MELTLEEVWKEVDDSWGDLLEVVKTVHDLQSFQMYDDFGELVPAERPMEESMICDKTERNRRFFYYLIAVNPSLAINTVQNADGSRLISISTGSIIPLRDGGLADEHVNGR